MDNAMLAKLTKGDRVVVVSAILFLLFSFLPWYGKSSYSRNGWDYFLFGVIPVILAVVMGAQVLVHRLTQTKMPDLPVPWGMGHVILGGIVVFLVFLRLAITDKFEAGIPGLGTVISVDLDRKYGLILAFLAAIGLLVGAIFKMQDPADATGSEAAPPAPGL